VPRPKEFDTDVACDAALGVFWRQGYEATSINDLVAELGIAKASLYATFGPKHQLYVTALERYIERTNARIVADLAGSGPALPAVRRLVHRYVDEILADSDRVGCLVINAAMERLPGDDKVARLVERSWDTLEVSLTMALTTARARGELPEDSRPGELARFLLTVLQGLRVVGKGAAAESRLRSSADVALRVLEIA
jgi:TetR/AcrR family transcriptional repressor of nem operon